MIFGVQFEAMTANGMQQFGPVFRKEFMHEALRLQKSIEGVCIIILPSDVLTSLLMIWLPCS